MPIEHRIEHRDGYRLWEGGPVPKGADGITIGPLVIVRRGKASPYLLRHELVHVLMDSGEHSEEPGNLMRDETAPGNTRLSAGQCDRLQAVGTENGLLHSR